MGRIERAAEQADRLGRPGDGQAQSLGGKPEGGVAHRKGAWSYAPFRAIRIDRPIADGAGAVSSQGCAMPHGRVWPVPWTR